MPYSAELSRTQPTAILFLIDQSNSMSGPFGGQTERSKAVGVADAVNRLLQNLVLKCAKGDGIRDYFHVGVVGYGGNVSWSVGNERESVPISAIANSPLRVEQRTRKVDDGAGGLVEQKFKFPIWLEPRAVGRTPMCQCIKQATSILAQFVAAFPAAFPPIVINITDGKATDGDPEPCAAELRKLATSDGNLLLFNAHLSSTMARPVEFASSESELGESAAKLLFRMSSPLPERMLAAARADGFAVTAQSRGFVYNADLVSVIRFLDVGTRAAPTVR